MSDQLMFDRLFDKLENLGEDIGELKESHIEIKTKITNIEDAVKESKEKDKEQDEAIQSCHTRHDKIEGALKFGAWVVGIIGITGAYKLAKDIFHG